MLKEIDGISISVAKSCFVQCNGCYNFFGTKREILSSKIILNFLSFLKEEFGVKKVTLCGGDPLSRPDILLLLDDIKRLGFFINLDTVGTPLLQDSRTLFYGRREVKKIDSKRLAKVVDILGIPLDGDTNESFLSFRKKRAKIFDEQIRILDILELTGAKVCINTVVHKQNIKIIKNIYMLIRKYRCIKKWQFFQYMPIGPIGFKNRDQYVVNDEEFSFFKESFLSGLSKPPNWLDFKFEFKSCSDRKGKYLLVDSDGFVWVPKASLDSFWGSLDVNDQRVLFGNINDIDQYFVILESFFNYSYKRGQILSYA